MATMIVLEAETFVTHTCPSCAVRYAVPQRFHDARHEDKAAFYCPNGHGASYRESEADRLRRERDRLKQDAARLEGEIALQRRQREAAEKEARRLRKKASEAECPCCTKRFGNLRAHLARKHPEFKAEEAA